MSEQESCSPSKLSKTSSDIRLYERVRLQSFQSLLHVHGSPVRTVRSSGKHPRVLLEDLLKAEVLSSQLVLAIEDLVNSLLGMLDTVHENGEDYGMSSTTEDESIKSFRSALIQSTNTLDELTKLQITENSNEVKDASNIGGKGSLFVNTASIVEQNATSGEDDTTDDRSGKVLTYGSDSTATPEKKSSSYSARESEFSSTSPSDVTVCEEDDMSGGEGNRRSLCDTTFLREAVKTLRNEIQELQTKHEVQFMTFAGRFIELEQDEQPTMRKILNKIIQKLTPQDHNWTFHGRLDEAEMEQLFYFVLLQKTLRSCLAVMNVPALRQFDGKMDYENTPPQENKGTQGGMVNGLCSKCCRSLKSNDDVGNKRRKEYEMCARNSTTLQVPKNETHYNSSDSNEESAVNGLPKSNLKRRHDFEDEQRNKRRKKGKSLFACFSGKWLRNNRRSKKN